jgi:hypothetical protein
MRDDGSDTAAFSGAGNTGFAARRRFTDADDA